MGKEYTDRLSVQKEANAFYWQILRNVEDIRSCQKLSRTEALLLLTVKELRQINYKLNKGNNETETPTENTRT